MEHELFKRCDCPEKHHMKPTCYLSYPMSGITDLNIVFETKAYSKLKDMGYWVFLPSKLALFVDRCIPDTQYKHYLGFDLWSLSRVDVMFLSSDWKISNGCKWEIEFALEHEIPIYIYDSMHPFTRDDYQTYLDSINNEIKKTEYKKLVFYTILISLIIQLAFIIAKNL